MSCAGEPSARPHTAAPQKLARWLGCNILRICQHLCKRFPGEKGERRLRSADKLAGCFQDALLAVSLC